MHSFDIVEITADKLKELLVKPGHVTEAHFEVAKKEADEAGTPLDEYLIEKDLIKDEQLGRLIAEDAHYQFMSLREEKIDISALSLIPELVARSKGVMVFARGRDGAKIAMLDPSDIETVNLIEKRVGSPIRVYYVTRRDFQDSLSRYKGTLKDEFRRVFSRLSDQSLSHEERDEAIVSMVDMLLRYGYESKVSDIHIEPHPARVLVRFRIDGVMHDVLEIPREIHDLILTRIKILAKMRTDEHRAAQDGKLVFESNEEKVDVRISVLPVTGGENIVMRILSAKSRQFSLTDLGLSDRDLERVKRSIESPHGMILVTGPTGSGKTTSVYAMLKILNTRDVHIATIEDPVEYDIEGISQIQVNPRTNLTFAKGLRAIVRQDPDIIMIGEIRDEETADIAVNSAMTGHLVLSTLHANDAATTLPRLLDMKIEPFLVASTVNIVIAQRLVRRICDRCRESSQLSAEERSLIENNKHIHEIFKAHKQMNLSHVRVYHGRGCAVCSTTGYFGRVGVFEVLEMDDTIKDLITKRAPSADIMKAAREAGMTTMLEEGIEKVLSGITTLEEIIRATKE